eukprot:3252585-Rhodomonas_salina.1
MFGPQTLVMLPSSSDASLKSSPPRNNPEEHFFQSACHSADFCSSRLTSGPPLPTRAEPLPSVRVCVRARANVEEPVCQCRRAWSA